MKGNTVKKCLIFYMHLKNIRDEAWLNGRALAQHILCPALHGWMAEFVKRALFIFSSSKN